MALVRRHPIFVVLLRRLFLLRIGVVVARSRTRAAAGIATTTKTKTAEIQKAETTRQGHRHRRGDRSHRLEQVEAAASEEFKFFHVVVGYGEERHAEEGRRVLSEAGGIAADGRRFGRFVGGGGVGYLIMHIMHHALITASFLDCLWSFFLDWEFLLGGEETPHKVIISSVEVCMMHGKRKCDDKIIVCHYLTVQNSQSRLIMKIIGP